MHLLLLVVLSAAWGSLYPVVKAEEFTIPPITMMALRATVATAVLGVVTGCQGRLLLLPWRRQGVLFCVGVMVSTIAWLSQGFGEMRVDAGVAAVLTTTIPIFTFVINAVVLRHDPCTASRIAGLAIGVTGLALTVGPSAPTGAASQLVGIGIISGGFFFYAVGGLIVARQLGDLDPFVTTTHCLFYGMITLVPLAFFFENPLQLALTPHVVLSVLWIGIVGTALPSLLYFLLIRRAGAFFAALFGYLVPLFGIVFGTIFLGEPLTARMAVGMALVLFGLWLLNRRPSSGAEAREDSAANLSRAGD